MKPRILKWRIVTLSTDGRSLELRRLWFWVFRELDECDTRLRRCIASLERGPHFRSRVGNLVGRATPERAVSTSTSEAGASLEQLVGPNPIAARSRVPYSSFKSSKGAKNCPRTSFLIENIASICTTTLTRPDLARAPLVSMHSECLTLKSVLR